MQLSNICLEMQNNLIKHEQITNSEQFNLHMKEIAKFKYFKDHQTHESDTII